MRHIFRTSMLIFAALVVAGALDAQAQNNLRQGALYVMSNLPEGNSILAYHRATDGTLTQAGEFPTDGLGNGTVPDALASQDGLAIAGQFLFAVNAGSDEITSFRIGKSQLSRKSTVSSGGTRPVSLAVNGNLVYVLNAGSGEITGFRVGPRGGLGPISGSTRRLAGGAGADPAQIAFIDGGSALMVTEKATNQIDVFPVDEDGVAGEPVVTESSGETPFGFAEDGDGHIFVSEAFGGAEGASAASSYSLAEDHHLTEISGSVENGQTATCWLVVSKDGRTAFVTNTGSGNVTTYRIAEDGLLSVRRADAATTGGNPIDLALTRNGRFLYVQVNDTGELVAFRVSSNGLLTPIEGVGGLPPFFQGIVAN